MSEARVKQIRDAIRAAVKKRLGDQTIRDPEVQENIREAINAVLKVFQADAPKQAVVVDVLPGDTDDVAILSIEMPYSVAQGLHLAETDEED